MYFYELLWQYRSVNNTFVLTVSVQIVIYFDTVRACPTCPYISLF